MSHLRTLVQFVCSRSSVHPGCQSSQFSPVFESGDSVSFSLSLVVSVVNSGVQKCLSTPKLEYIVSTMKSSPTRKYESFTNDQQGKETDKYSLDSQDTASVVSTVEIIDLVLLYYTFEDIIDLVD